MRYYRIVYFLLLGFTFVVACQSSAEGVTTGAAIIAVEGNARVTVSVATATKIATVTPTVTPNPTDTPTPTETTIMTTPLKLTPQTTQTPASASDSVLLLSSSVTEEDIGIPFILETATPSVALLIDPEIETLMNAVSQQNLLTYVQTLEGFGTRHTFSETQRDDFGIGAARRWIHDEFVRVNGGALEVTYQDFSFNYNGLVTIQQNVVATLPGITDDPGVIVVTAHYDSRNANPIDGEGLAPGANDNASGVALLLELARLMSSRPWNKTIMFVAFAAEEQGTGGSKFFVQDSLLNGRTIEAVLNNDIVGGRPGIPQSIRVFSPGSEANSQELSISQQLARHMALVAGLYMPDFGVDLFNTLDREGRFGDQREFINAGLVGVRITESVEDVSVQHTGLDRSELLDFSYLRRVVQFNLVTVATLAGFPGTPPVAFITPMAG